MKLGPRGHMTLKDDAIRKITGVRKHLLRLAG
ncbi:hypothetical protein AAur_pTC20240 (plasmid) [Paenarthrobacter aurescens TC1]|uniref:Uncharacterized protein n=1 Tax=Paenarthrobacter aurescens (strain TC1) TaxID=290340 RepID=A1RDS6_PAEAT|nr:hypothetical protein AAur_pTC20240 [Paenarthrobacter aurescens TC1]